jgi:hypothetical protein
VLFRPTLLISTLLLAASAVGASRKVVDPHIRPEQRGGATFVPADETAEALGATLHFQEFERGIALSRGKLKARFEVGSRIAFLNGKRVTLDAAPYVKEHDAMLPLRPLAMGLGLSLRMDAETQSALLETADRSKTWAFPLKTSRTGIVVHSPAPDAAFRRIVRVEGQANLSEPLIVRLQHADGTVLDEVELSCATGYFRPFIAELVYSGPDTADIEARVTASAKGSACGGQSVSVPVKLRFVR